MLCVLFHYTVLFKTFFQHFYGDFFPETLKVFEGYGGCRDEIPEFEGINVPNSDRELVNLLLQILRSQCDKYVKQSTQNLFDSKIVNFQQSFIATFNLEHEIL